ncbi:MAG TPA: prolyl oligopeptidase family serine peptidase, partial [Thermoanaerobaculia bacterium]
QNAYTRSVLDGLPGRRALEAKLLPLLQVGSVDLPVMRAGRYFYLEREGDQNQPSLYLREGAGGPRRLLLDPARLDPSGLTTISELSPTEDGKLLAYTTFRAGDERTTIHLLEVASGRTLPLAIGGRADDVSWLPDASGFFYRNLSDVENPYSGQVRFHRMGTDPRTDRLLIRQYTPAENAKLASTFGPYAEVSRDGRWLIVGYFTSNTSNDVWVADARRFVATGELVKVPVLVGEDAQSFGTVSGGTLFLQTTSGAPHGRIVAVDLAHPDRAHWRPLVAERQDATIEGLQVARGRLAVRVLAKAYDRLELYGFDGRALGELPLPGIGSAEIDAEPDRTEAFVRFESFNFPTSIYRLDLASPRAAPALWERPAVPVDPASAVVDQVWYPSKDGTRVSLFIVHKKGLKLDGDNPTLLTGYGGFDISEKPAFSATLFAWLDAGGVFAVANLRGGGEYGDAWHRAGMLDRKQNVFDDFLAAAEYLIRSGYTSPRRLGIQGASNGGLLMGAALTQRPDLFAAVLCQVPLLDMLRYQDFLMGKYWVSEYGSAENRDQLPYLLAYSPYQHVKPGTRYPAVFLTGAENDARVHALHARKMTAALRAADASDQSVKPILLWVERDAGHGSGKPLSLRVRDAADDQIFLMWQLGMLPGERP